MGLGKHFECPKCGNEIEILEGIGMMWHSFKPDMFYPPKKDSYGLNFYDEFDENTLKEIHKFIEEAEDVFVENVYYQPYICKKCGKVETKVYFRIESDGKAYRPKYFCECGGKYIRLTNKKQKHLHCNKCGAKMSDPRELCWD